MVIAMGPRTNWRLMLLVAAPMAAGLAAVALVAGVRDPSPLGDLPDSIAVARDVSYGPTDRHRLDIAYERACARPRPAIVMIHQGGWFQGDKAAYHGLMAEYARLGYVTVSINFRPSGVARFPAALDDGRLALRWLRDHAARYGVDPARIGVTGWSSGAHLAMLVALSDGSAGIRAAVCVSGVYDLLMEESGLFPNHEGDEAVVRFLGGTPREKPELARLASPITHLSKDDPPLLVLHGELDRRIDVEQARHFAAALRALGRSDEVVLLPAGDHGRDVLPADPEIRRRVRDFFARHLRPED